MLRKVNINFFNSLNHLKRNRFIKRASYTKSSRLLENQIASIQYRYYSSENDKLKDVLKNIKDKVANKSNEGEVKDNSNNDSKENLNNDNENSKSDDINSNKNDDSNTSKFNIEGVSNIFTSSYKSLVENVKLAYAEMVGDGKESALERKVEQAQSFRQSKKSSDNNEENIQEEEYTGPNALVFVKEPLNPWEQMKERLKDSPFIREILKNTSKIGKAAADTDIGKKAQDIGRSFNDKISDAREFWETSQNPLVYSISGIWENMTGETEEGIAIGEIRKLDPQFSKEEWAEEVKNNLVPKVIKAHLQGNTSVLKPLLGEGAFNKLSADIKMRKQDGIVFDSNLLDIDENRIIIKFLENGGPVIVIIYMVQQINCIKNRKGEIIEGGETEIRAKFYSLAFQQNYDDEKSVVAWKVVDYEFAGDIPYY